MKREGFVTYYHPFSFFYTQRNYSSMRISRSCSPGPKTCIRTCNPDCCKPCCLPRRRCQSLSPRRHRRRFFERLTCSPSDSDLCRSYDSSCLPRSRNCMPRMCNPCQPRRCSFRDSDLYSSKACFSRKYFPCSPPYSSRRDTYFPRTCEPCVTERDHCLPRICVPSSPCYPRICRPYSRRKWNSYISCSPCFPLKCNPCYQIKCDPCYTSRRRPKPDCYVPRTCSPLYSPLRETCGPCNSRTSRRRYCSPCDEATEALTNIKLRDLRCDNFSKVCYPKELPLKPCSMDNCKCGVRNCSCVAPQEAACEVAKVDTIKHATDDGPSCNFLQKSRRLGTCMSRYEPHFCPWEADVSISGTVRGHCTSTAVEVARRMSGRFRAEGDRFTKDSCESIAPCTPDCQKMSLGRLDDGTSLNFSRNMSRNDNKCEESVPAHNNNLTKSSYRSKKNRRSENHSENYNSCYSVACGQTHDVSLGNKKPPGLPSGEQTFSDGGHKEQQFFDNDLKDQKLYCSRRPSNHSVRFGSKKEASSSKSASETKHLPQTSQVVSPSYSEIQSFLNSRKDRRRRNRVRTPPRDISRHVLKNSQANPGSDHGECKSPSSYSYSQHRVHVNSEGDSPLFTPPTHCSSLSGRRFASSTSRDDLDNLSTYKEHTRKKTENTEYHEISLDGDPRDASRHKSYRQKRGVDGLLENKRRR